MILLDAHRKTLKSKKLMPKPLTMMIRVKSNASAAVPMWLGDLSVTARSGYPLEFIMFYSYS